MYTKGEWKVGEPFHSCGDEIPIYGEDHHELARIFIHNGEQFANAHLIAAAPALYEALKELQRVYAGYSFGTDKRSIPSHWNKALEALARAEGK